MHFAIESGQIREISTTVQVFASEGAVTAADIVRAQQAPWDLLPGVVRGATVPRSSSASMSAIAPRLTASRNSARGDEQT